MKGKSIVERKLKVAIEKNCIKQEKNKRKERKFSRTEKQRDFRKYSKIDESKGKNILNRKEESKKMKNSSRLSTQSQANHLF